MIRASLVRALVASAVVAGGMALAGCNLDGAYELPTRAMKELSPQMVALLEQKNMPKDSPILVRIFKEESELEVWKQDTTGRFQLLKVYPICRWSGDLGPKVREGDRQAPEGFYTITPDLMNPNSGYYLAINTGFPNAYDRANDRHGAFLMIHGDCSSRGCYAMTDEQIGEIYSLARESLLGGQQSFQIQAYPFRMTPANLARHRNNPNMPFWRMIKEGNDHFEVTHLEPKIEVCNRRYIFDPQPPPGSTQPLVFNPIGRCPVYIVAPEIAGLALEKQRNDDAQFAQMVRSNVALAPIRSGVDGGMNRVFLAQVGSLPPARVTPPTPAGSAGPETTGAASTEASRPAGSGGWLGHWFGSRPAGDTTQVAATDSASQERGGGGGGGFFSNLFSSKSESSQPASAPRGSELVAPVATPRAKPAPHHETVSTAALRLKPADGAADPHKTSAKPKPAGQKEASATPPAQGNRPASSGPTASNGGVLNGAQPVVPVGSFDSRWGGLH